MALTRLSAQSLESVKHQPNPRMFRDLVVAFTFLRNSEHKLSDSKDDRNVIKESKIESIVKHYSGLSINFRCGSDIGINAYVMPPTLDRNHPLMSKARRQWTDNEDAVLQLEKAKRLITGTVDLDEGRVSGVYSKIVSDVYVAAQIAQDDLFTVEETVAIFMHELGHLMTYYEYLGRAYLVNHVLGDLIREYGLTDSPKHRIKLLEVTKDALNLTELDPNDASRITDAGTIQTLIVSEIVNTPVSGGDTRVYDHRAWEALADQYVSRMGAGRHLATGLDRLFRLSGSSSYYSNLQYLMIESISVIAIGLFFPKVFLLLSLLAGLLEPDDIYDPPGERLKRIRRDMVDAMKNPRIDKDYRKRLQEDVEMVSDLLSGIKDRESIVEYLWKRIYPGNRKQMNRVKMMQEFETLANNELFVTANLLTVKA